MNGKVSGRSGVGMGRCFWSIHPTQRWWQGYAVGLLLRAHFVLDTILGSGKELRITEEQSGREIMGQE